MLTRLDHLVILVRDLDRASRDYGRLGFRVMPGGEHADGLTRNALIPFRDGTYLELVAFIDPGDPTDNVWGWRGFAGGEGPIDYCAASDDLDDEVRRLRALGLEVNGPHDGGRRTADGREIRWRSASIVQDGRALPFLIQDLTPRGARVPSGPDAEHPNGVTGIAGLEISTPSPEATSARLAALAGVDPATIKLGACELVPVAGEEGGFRTVWLSTAGQGGPAELDRALARGVRFVRA